MSQNFISAKGIVVGRGEESVVARAADHNFTELRNEWSRRIRHSFLESSEGFSLWVRTPGLGRFES